MASYWAWTVLILVLFRAALEFRIMADANAKRHKYEFSIDLSGRGWKYLKLFNLTVFVLHCVLLGIFWFEDSLNSINYWFYALTVYYFLQDYLAFIVPRQDRDDERIAIYIIYASFASLVVALAGLLYDDFCPNTNGTICDESQARYYGGLWPIEAIAVVLYGSLDCLLWARKAEVRCCPDALSGYGIQLQKDEPVDRYAATGSYINSSDTRPFSQA